jgi:hypothetical protein
MNFPRTLLAALAIALLASGCVTNPYEPEGDDGLDDKIKNALNKVCPIPSTTNFQVENKLRALRGELMLAAVAGYAIRSVSSYSTGDDRQTDAALVLLRLNAASKDLSGAVQAAAAIPSNHLFPLYRTDAIIAIANAAEAALRPTLREVKSLAMSLTSFSLDKVKRAKTLFLNAIENELYREAIGDSCYQLNFNLGATETKSTDPQKPASTWALTSVSDGAFNAARKYTGERLVNRCEKLAALANNSSLKCEVEWKDGTTTPAGK